MAGPTDILTAVQNGVVALSNLGKQVSGSFNNISSQLTANAAAITSLSSTVSALSSTIPTTYVRTIAGNSSDFTLNAASGITNTVNDIQLSQGSSSQFGAVKVDGTSITAAAGVITAKSARALLNTLVAANSSVLSDTTSFSSAYPQYEIEFDNVLPGVSSSALELQVHTGGTFISSGGYIANVIGWSNGSATALNSAPTTFIPITPAQVGSASPGVGAYGRIRVLNPTSTNFAKLWEGLVSWSAPTFTGSALISGFYNSAAAVDGFQVLFSSSNITSGTVKIYGIQ